ncbi:MFS transporter [Burkholderia gladioli]|uniref:MFS transporter n=1 Tax=Burkholderia gladioli TaxID=28095 RepID=UPI0016411DA9|nr:MFS transporter [Burkholderia gladioli]
MTSQAMHYRWWVLFASTVTQLSAALASQGIGVWGSLAQQRFALTNTQLGLLAGLANAVPAIGLLVIGRLLDRYGERGPVFAGMVVLTIAMLLLGEVSGFALLIVAMLLIGVGYSPIQPGGSKAIYHWFPPTQRGFAMGIRQAALPLGGACAAALFPPLIRWQGWHVAMLVAAGCLAAGAGLFVVLYRNAVPSRRPDGPARFSQRLLQPMHRQVFRQVASIGVVMVAAQTAVSMFWILFVERHFGVSFFRGAELLVVVQMAGTVGRVALSALSDRFIHGRQRVVYGAAAVIVIMLVLMNVMPIALSSWALGLASSIIGFFGFGWYGPWVVWLSETCAADEVGEVLAAAMALNQVAIAVTPFAFGFLLDATSAFQGAWLGHAGLISLVLLAVFHQRSSSGRPISTAP